MTIREGLREQEDALHILSASKFGEYEIKETASYVCQDKTRVIELTSIDSLIQLAGNLYGLDDPRSGR